jgi:hypothetical protein
MNREDIIRIAHESHLDVYGLGTDYAKFADALERFATLVASAEREACAKLCEDIGSKDYTFYREESSSSHCADAIRARGQA